MSQPIFDTDWEVVAWPWPSYPSCLFGTYMVQLKLGCSSVQVRLGHSNPVKVFEPLGHFDFLRSTWLHVRISYGQSSAFTGFKPLGHLGEESSSMLESITDDKRASPFFNILDLLTP